MTAEEFIKKSIGVRWTDKGRDCHGWDCWGLVVCFYQEVFNIDLRPFEDISFTDAEKALLSMREETRRWPKISPGSERFGDLVVWRPLHACLVMGGGKMLHCVEGSETCIERYDNAIWRERLLGFYRHIGM